MSNIYNENDINSNTTSRLNSNNREICKYFLYGNCRFGESCFYSHDANASTNILSRSQRGNNNNNDITDSSHMPIVSNHTTTTPICKYFLMGRCIFGDSCFYRHNNDINSLATSFSNTNLNNVESPSTSSDSSSTSTTFDFTRNNENTNSSSHQVVRRFINKPKLVYANLTSSENGNTESKSKQTATTTPSNVNPVSYYEALTGKKLSLTNLDDSDLNMFDENYKEYLRLKAQQQEKEIQLNSLDSIPVCPYFEKQVECPFGEYCEYVHGEVCEICQLPCLHPTNKELREQHKKDCLEFIEKDMEEAFAVQCSKEKTCGICMDTVWEKESDKRFGILENCNHIFCLDCIRKWRSSKIYENKIVKACPECRVKSDYVTPSKYWFDNEDSKMKIINEYKKRLGQSHCKYFKRGDGSCPFGNKCFYLHQYKDGRNADLPDPAKRRRFNRYGDLESYSNLVRIDFDYSDDDEEVNEFDIIEFLRNHLMLVDTDDESDLSELFELSSEFSNFF